MPNNACNILYFENILLNNNKYRLRIYDQFNKHPKNDSKLLQWIYSYADSILEEKFSEEEIAEIKSCRIREVEDALRNTRTFLKERIRSWTAPAEEEAG